MRLLVSSSIFLLVMLIASESATAKKCGRENSCRKERNAAALEKSNYDEKDCAAKYNLDESRNRKRRAVDECQLERSNRKDSSRSDGEFEEGEDSRKKLRITEKQKKGRGEEKRSRRKEETSRSCNVDKPKRKFDSKTSPEHRKSSESRSEGKTCRHCREDTSDNTDYSEDDIISNSEESEEDSSASDDSE